MNGPEFELLLYEGTGDDLRDAVVELAWVRTRRACGLGPGDPPFSLHEDTVTDEHRSAYAGQVALLSLAANEAMAELMAAGWPPPHNVTPIRPEDR